MAYSTKNRRPIEHKDVKNSCDRGAIWAALSPTEREFMKELNDKFNIKLVSGDTNDNIRRSSRDIRD